ncbi:thrombomodulin [Patagioenas fasciata monilis]|uniref:Thrombomodulin n=1 Tax=Patagioenas fasciata monilis TaxID=372326 RepID=A0A1V4IG90_PATFA|nr:thrombomodulin [Patagioenas fasciata monilis]
MRRLPLLLLLLLLLGLGVRGEPGPAAPSGAQCLEHDCFGIFWAARSFAEASGECERSGGHLMTVRSTVAEDAIALLLQNRSGRLWLGLRLERSLPCTQPAQRLRGFQWVTGDRSTDYSNWASSERRCGKRCVTVSRQLRWEERSCESTADGFFCEYNYKGSCPRLPPAEGLLVTYTTPFDARGGDFVVLPAGSIASVPEIGLDLRCNEEGDSGGLRWGRDAPGAWACRLANGGCEGTCGEEGGRPRCSCPDGKVLATDGRSCSSPCAGAPCQHHCIVTGTTFLCMCEPGYQLAADGSSCKDIDDCAVSPQLCEQVCVNTEGGFECQCFRGYKMLDGHCRPISHCYQAPCDQKCEEVPDGYRCGCSPGYIVDPREPSHCVLHCNRSQCPAQCDPHSLSCECPEGFVLDDAESEKICVDINECDMNYCQHDCVNHPGGYECRCHAGYQLLNQNDCGKILEEDGDGGYSGDLGPEAQTPIPSRTPPKAEHLHPGALVGIAMGALSAALALLALGYHLAKKRCGSPSSMDYKCGGPHEKEMGLQPVTSGCAASSQKL